MCVWTDWASSLNILEQVSNGHALHEWFGSWINAKLKCWLDLEDSMWFEYMIQSTGHLPHPISPPLTYIQRHTHIYIYMYAYLPTCIRANMPTYRGTCLHIDIHTYLHPFLPTYLLTYLPSCIHVHIHSYIQRYLPRYIHQYIPIPTYMRAGLVLPAPRTSIHPSIHPYIHTYIHT